MPKPSIASPAQGQPSTDRAVELPLFIAPSGFASPAEDCTEKRFDVQAWIAPRPVSTFSMRVAGDSMRDAGIPPGCLITVDRSLRVQHGDIAVVIYEGDFKLCYVYQREGGCELCTADGAAPLRICKDLESLQVWGVVVGAVVSFVHPHRRG
jgi:DNA polymerase V